MWELPEKFVDQTKKKKKKALRKVHFTDSREGPDESQRTVQYKMLEARLQNPTGQIIRTFKKLGKAAKA